MNVTISVGGAHVTTTIHDYYSLSALDKNKILNFVLDDENETVHHIKGDGYLVITGEFSEMYELLTILWDIM